MTARAERADRWAVVGRWFLYAAAASLAFMRPQVRLFGLPATGTDLLVAAAALAWLLAGLLDRRWWQRDRFFRLLACYFAAMIASAIFADRSLAHFLPRLASEAYLLAIPVICVGLLRDEAALRRAAGAWVIGLAAVILLAAVSLVAALIAPKLAVLTLVQHHLGSLSLGPLVRYKLAYINPNMLGAYLSASLMMVLAAADMGWIAKRPAILLVSGLCMTVIATFSAGIAGVCLAGALWFGLKHHRKRPVATAVVALAGWGCAAVFLLALALTPYPQANAAFALRVPGTTIVLEPASRLQVWIAASRTFLAHPLTGVGVGDAVAHVRFVEPGGAAVVLKDAHNLFLNVAATCGMFGFLALLAIGAGVWRRTGPFGAPGTDGYPARSALGIGVLQVLLYQGMGGAFEDSRFLWFQLGLLLVASRVQPGSLDPTARHKDPPLPTP